jgi:hypothetical protein
MTQSTSEIVQELLPVFSTIFTRDTVQGILQDLGIKMYWRAYTPLVVLWGFLFQRLHPDHTCDNYVAYLHSGKGDQLDPADRHRQPLSQRLCSESNAGYVQGRNRLPLALLEMTLPLVYEQIQSWLGDEGLWQGHAVRLLDGSTFTLAPLGDLATTYGRSSNQHGQHHWVKVRTVASFDLISQAAVALVEAPYAVGETSLVLPVLQADPEDGALYIGDRNFGVYRVLQAAHATSKEALVRLQKQQWQSLMRRNGINSLEAGESYPCVWQPSRHDTLLEGIPAPAISGRLLYIRLQKTGFRPIDLYLFTTLLDEQRYPVAALTALYARRYASAEGDLRHLKTTLELDNLCAHSAAMFRKELFAGLLAYNLVRALMTRAARLGKQEVTSLSFVQAKRRLYRVLFEDWPSWLNSLAATTHNLCRRLGACRLPSRVRKIQHEPRCKRYRWRRYPPLTTDRPTAHQLHLQQIKEIKEIQEYAIS